MQLLTIKERPIADVSQTESGYIAHYYAGGVSDLYRSIAELILGELGAGTVS